MAVSDMVRNGLYAFFEGKEYRAAKTDDAQIKLIYEGAEPPRGFVKTPYGNYTSVVAEREVSALLLVKSYAVLNGISFEIADESQDGVVITTSDERLAREYGMEQEDRHDYRKKIPREQIERIMETKREVR